jgi:hypothetical protein
MVWIWVRVIRSSLSSAGWIVLLALAVGACSSKTPQYPADHERIRSIDQAVDALRDAYQGKNPSRFRSMMQSADQLDQLQRQVEADFEAFHAISLEFKIERVVIEGDDIDVYIHWQGVWKKQADDTGMRQRGHARLQWVGTGSILLRGVQGDLPFGMKAKQALSEAPVSQPAP